MSEATATIRVLTLALALALALAIVVSACGGSQVKPMAAEQTRSGAQPPSSVLLAADVEWQPLNPARGDASPMAATLWGDRGGSGPTGFLVRFVDGFSSLPHIHNVDYRGLVIDGLIHNDDPDADEMWMPAGSYWTQPSGEVHITAARGN